MNLEENHAEPKKDIANECGISTWPLNNWLN